MNSTKKNKNMKESNNIPLSFGRPTTNGSDDGDGVSSESDGSVTTVRDTVSKGSTSSRSKTSSSRERQRVNIDQYKSTNRSCSFPSSRHSEHSTNQQFMKSTNKPQLSDQAEEKVDILKPSDKIDIAILATYPLVCARGPHLCCEPSWIYKILDKAELQVKIYYGKLTRDSLEHFLRTADILLLEGHNSQSENLHPEDGFGAHDKVSIKSIIKGLKDVTIQTKLMILSMCYSKIIGQYFYDAGISTVICVNENWGILDDNARKFSIHFFEELFESSSIMLAYDRAKVNHEKMHYTLDCCCGHYHLFCKGCCPKHQQVRQGQVVCCRPDLHKIDFKIEILSKTKEKTIDFQWKKGDYRKQYWKSYRKINTFVEDSYFIHQRRCDVYLLLNQLSVQSCSAIYQYSQIVKHFETTFREYYDDYKYQIKKIDFNEEKSVFLLWGPSGSGKTCVVQMLMKVLSDHWYEPYFNGGVLYISLADTILKDVDYQLQEKLKHETDRVVLVAIDQIEKAIQNEGDMKSLDKLIKKTLDYYGRNHLKILLIMCDRLKIMYERIQRQNSTNDYYTYELVDIDIKEALMYLIDRLNCRRDLYIPREVKCIRQLLSKYIQNNTTISNEMKIFLQECTKRPQLLRLFIKFPTEFFEYFDKSINSQDYGLNWLCMWCLKLESLDRERYKQNFRATCIDQLQEFIDTFKK